MYTNEFMRRQREAKLAREVLPANVYDELYLLNRWVDSMDRRIDVVKSGVIAVLVLLAGLFAFVLFVRT